MSEACALSLYLYSPAPLCVIHIFQEYSRKIYSATKKIWRKHFYEGPKIV